MNTLSSWLGLMLNNLGTIKANSKQFKIHHSTVWRIVYILSVFKTIDNLQSPFNTQRPPKMAQIKMLKEKKKHYTMASVSTLNVHDSCSWNVHVYDSTIRKKKPVAKKGMMFAECLHFHFSTHINTSEMCISGTVWAIFNHFSNCMLLKKNVEALCVLSIQSRNPTWAINVIITLHW